MEFKTQQELAEKYGISQAFVSQALRDRVPVVEKRQIEDGPRKKTVGLYNEKLAADAIRSMLEDRWQKKKAVADDAKADLTRVSLIIERDRSVF